jgi:hypothetical protein
MFMHHYGTWCRACESKMPPAMRRMHVVTRYANDAVQSPKGTKVRFWHPVGHDIRVLPFRKRHGMLGAVSLGRCLKNLSEAAMIDQPVALRRSRPVFCIVGNLFGRKTSKSIDSKSEPSVATASKVSTKKGSEKRKKEGKGKETPALSQPSAPPCPVPESESSSPEIYPQTPELKNGGEDAGEVGLGEWLFIILDLFSPIERLEMALTAARDVVINVDRRGIPGTFNVGADIVPYDIAHVMIAAMAGEFHRSFKETGSLHWMQSIVDFFIARCYVQEQERIDCMASISRVFIFSPMIVKHHIHNAEMIFGWIRQCISMCKTVLWAFHVVMVQFLENHKSAMKHSSVDEWENAIYAFDSCFDFPSECQWTSDLEVRTRFLTRSIECISCRSSSVLDAEGSWDLVPGVSDYLKK